MKKLILHIGFNKTGTTSIQKDLTLNADRLLAQGILYPCDPNASYVQRWQHLPLAAAIPDRRVPWLSPAKRKSLGRAFSDLKSYIADQNFQTLLISSENFGAPDMTESKVRWVQQQFSGYDITVLAYIRRQDAYFLSTYQQSIKAGRSRAFDFEEYKSERLLRFASRLAPWRAVFGSERVIVRPFDGQFWPERQLFLDFLASFGADPTGVEITAPENEGLDFRAVEIFRQLNELSDGLPAKASRVQLAAFQSLFREMLPNLPAQLGWQKMQLSTAQSIILRDYFRSENIVALEGSGIDVDAFFPEIPTGIPEWLVPEQLSAQMLLRLVYAATLQQDADQTSTTE